MRRRAERLCAAAIVATALLLVAAVSASAQSTTESEAEVGAAIGGPLTEVSGDLPETPADYEVSAEDALRVADRNPKILERKDELTSSDRLTAQIKSESVRIWEVGYYLNDEKVNLVIVDGESGIVTDSWTGPAVDWPMARGKPGQFGHILNAPWVWIPLALIFVAGLWDFRRWRKWVHLDLLVLLSFGISQAFFNAAEIDVSVPLYYPPLVYLLLRMLWIGFRGVGRDGGTMEGLRPSASTRLLLIGVILLVGLRLAGNLADSGVVDVGYAGVIGADKITSAEPIYDGSFPDDNPTGDTYGPANYFAYVPFELIFPWDGTWGDLPAAHAAAIFFDLATIAGLFALGLGIVRRRGGTRGDGLGLGVILAFAWVAYPYTAFAMQGNVNDALISALLVWSLAAFASPFARGALLATASMAKFAPLPLFPLYAAGERGLRLREPDGIRSRIKPLLIFTAGFALFAALLLAHPAVDPGLGKFWERTVETQLDRESPFSIWGITDLEWLQTIIKGGVIALGIAVAFVPRRRSLPQIAALSAALIIGVEITLEHWFYLYIPWFLGAMLVAMAARPDAES